MNLNKVLVLGNLTRDPERRALPSGDAVTNLGIATNRYYTTGGEKKQETEFHNIVLFGKLAEIADQYLKKGSLVLIEGRLRTRSWESQDGQKRYRTEIVADKMQLGPKNVVQTPAPSPQINSRQEDIPVIEEDESKDEIDVKDIPF